MIHSERSIINIAAILPMFIALFLFISGTNATAEEKDANTVAAQAVTKTVAVLPFEMHAPSSLAYLQEGLRDMLASRLAANGGEKLWKTAGLMDC